MCHTSPASMLIWAILFTLLGAFLLFHLWSFDRFKCLKWNSGPYSGAFKRIMTYSYLLSVPLTIGYATGFATIKYNEGYIEIPSIGIIPKPYQLWDPGHRRFIFPLYLMFSVAWSLEMVTHLEELCFWLFLINAGSGQQDWFRSPFFKSWAIGSVCAVIYMPLLTILTKADPLRCEAFTFLGGSLGSLSLTIWFIPVLWTFPMFLKNLKKEGVDISTIVRLTKFHELNILRIIFRFLFVIPLLILAADGVRPHPNVNTVMVWTDTLAMIAAIGVVVSSAITLVIFFPRSIEGELTARESRAARKSMSALVDTTQSVRSLAASPTRGASTVGHEWGGAEGMTGSRTSVAMSQAHHTSPASPASSHKPVVWKTTGSPPPPPKPAGPRGASWQSAAAAADGRDAAAARVKLEEEGREDQALRRQARTLQHRSSKINPLVRNYTSPIDLAYTPTPQPSYTFVNSLA